MQQAATGLALALPLAAPALAQCDGAFFAAPGQKHEEFGASIARSGFTSVVGAPGHGALGAIDVGALYVYEFDGSSWVQQSVHVASDAQAQAQLGFSVAVDGERAIAGAKGDEPAGYLSELGAAYVFERGPSGWSEVQKLTPSDAWADELLDAKRFGWSVDLEGERAIVGAPYAHPDWPGTLLSETGAVYVYERDAQSGLWSEVQRLLPAQFTGGELFGTDVDLDGDRLVVGARRGSVGSESTGSVHVFEWSAALDRWVEVSELAPSGLQAGADFGRSVDLRGDRLAVGADRVDVAGTNSAGAVYVYERDAQSGAWVLVEELSAPEPVLSGNFGLEVGLGSERLCVGARPDFPATDGSVYVYERDPASGLWDWVDRIDGPNGEGWNAFGHAFVLSEQELLVGERWGDGLGAGHGSAHVVDLSGEPCLDADVGVLPIVGGGTQSLSLDASESHPAGGALYLVLGSTGPTAPGLLIDGHLLPLSFDAWFVQTLIAPSATPLQNSLGLLDAQGGAQASFVLPPNAPAALLGVQLHHAAVLVDLLHGAVVGASNAVPLSFAP